MRLPPTSDSRLKLLASCGISSRSQSALSTRLSRHADPRPLQSKCKIYVMKLWNELVAHSVYGLDVFRLRGVPFQLGAQPGDVVIHCAAGRILVISPHLVQ